MQFSGEINEKVEEEFRNLYFKRHPLYPITFSFFGVALVVMAVILLLKIGGANGTIFGVILLIAAVALFVIAFRLPQLWWRWWWPKFLSGFGRNLSCEVMPDGIRFKPGDVVIEWKRLTATKQSDTLILLYLSQAAAYPIHRSMADSPSDWEELVSLTRKNIRPTFW